MAYGQGCRAIGAAAGVHPGRGALLAHHLPKARLPQHAPITPEEALLTIEYRFWRTWKSRYRRLW